MGLLTFLSWRGLAIFLVAVICVGCGAKEDYSGANEVVKTQGASDQATAAAGKGASVHPALMVPQQKHP